MVQKILQAVVLGLYILTTSCLIILTRYFSYTLFFFNYRKGGLNGDIINPIQSARMRTINSFSFTYGTVEIRAKMSRGDWIWPCIFLKIILVNTAKKFVNSLSIDVLHSCMASAD